MQSTDFGKQHSPEVELALRDLYRVEQSLLGDPSGHLVEVESDLQDQIRHLGWALLDRLARLGPLGVATVGCPGDLSTKQ